MYGILLPQEHNLEDMKCLGLVVSNMNDKIQQTITSTKALISPVFKEIPRPLPIVEVGLADEVKMFLSVPYCYFQTAIDTK